MSNSPIAGPVFWLILRKESTNQNRALLVAKVIAFSIIVLFMLALAIVILSTIVYALSVDSHSISGYRNLFIPNFFSILVASVPIGIVYGFFNLYRLKLHLSNCGMTFEDFESMSVTQRQSLLAGKQQD